MWLSNRRAQAQPKKAAVGEVTIGGTEGAVYTDAEKRNASFFAPGGYFWVPSAGQSMVVIKSEDNETCLMGREVTELPVEMQEGEV